MVLTAALARVNERISRLVFRIMDEASGRSTTEYSVPIEDVEYALGTELVETGRMLKQRAIDDGFEAVEHQTFDGVEIQVIDGQPANPRRKPDIPEF